MSDRCLYDISRFSGRRGFHGGLGVPLTDYPYFCEKRTEREVADVIQLVKSTHSGPVFAKAAADVLALRGVDFDEQLNQVKYLLNVV